ncbi:MAG TPA: DUF5995 family protein [Actinomycetota bacterium]
MAAQSLPPLPSGPVASIPEAVARMQAIEAALPPGDGLACFNRMYLIVTQTVKAQVTQGFFADPAFMEHLDIVFANLYLGAVDGSCVNPSTACRAWNVLFSRRSDTSVVPMQFALAGMNAHINHDLALAVVTACRDLGTVPESGSHEADFNKVNRLLAALDPQIRQSFESGLILELDQRAAAGLENIAGNFGIDAARETAWVNAQALWHVRDISFIYKQYLDGMDRTAAFAGRSLLIPLV